VSSQPRPSYTSTCCLFVRDVLSSCVSELSLYQATSKKLEGDCLMCSEALAIARHRLESGDAPTEDAEREWRRQLRVVEMRDIVANAKAEEERINALM